LTEPTSRKRLIGRLFFPVRNGDQPNEESVGHARCRVLQNKSKNGRYILVTVRTHAVKYTTEPYEMLKKPTKRPVLAFSEIPTVCFFRNRSGVTAIFSNSFSFN
jgi:hypothetical protein